VLTLRGLALAVVVAGCAHGAGAPDPVPTTVSDYRPSQLRLTAVTVRVVVGPRADVPDRERASLPRAYEGALVEGLDGRAVVVRDVRSTTTAEPPAVAAARAREVGADHAIVVDVRIEPDVVRVCEETSRPLRGRATVFKQHATIVRASDAAVRTAVDVKVPGVEADCDAARPSVRSRTATATVLSAVERLLGRLLPP
jgi:hypothetical protein